MTRQSIEKSTFLLLLVAVSLAFLLVISNFYGAIFWALILALIFMPLHRRFLKLFGDRPNAASFASLSVCILLAIIPMILIIFAIVQECMALIKSITDETTGKITITPYLDQLWAAIPDSLKEWIDRIGVEELADIRSKFEQAAASTASVVGKTLVGWGQNAFGFAVAFCVMLYLLFFLFRDGEKLAQQVVDYVPLSPSYKKHLFQKFITVVKATVKGNIVVAIIQGALGGIAFYALDVQGALLWGVLMSFLSLLPAVGASLVWGPVAIYFLATGKIGAGIFLIVFGSLVIGMVDNVLRPILVGKDTKLPDYVVLITTLGGMSLVGLNGFVIGPLIAALFIAAWGLLDQERTEEARQKEQRQQYRPRRKGRKEKVPEGGAAQQKQQSRDRDTQKDMPLWTDTQAPKE